ncbi:MAG: T9SS type A sorting domain-containing protein [Ignavibacteriae bacterium]|nr:T9SS type A sorting domain-containing protein [Ignavibacteriota bacterium]
MHEGSATTEQGVYRSTDDGANWTGSYNTGIWRSTNNGANRTSSGTSQTGAVTIFGAVQHPGGTIYMNTLLSCLRSTDDGAAWSSVSLGWFEQLWVMKISGNTLLFGTPAGLYKSTDNGGTWRNHKDGLMWTQIGYLATDPSGYIYAGTSSGLYKSDQPIINAVSEIDGEIPTTFSLEQNYPNPFNPTTNFGFQITNFGLVTLKIIDVLGREVATLVNEELYPGTYQTAWNAKGQASGMYFYRLNTGDFSETKQMLIMI